MTTKKGFLICPASEEITEVEYTGIVSIYQHIGCDLIDAVRNFHPDTANDDVIYVDDEGLLKKPECFFYVAGTASPLAGNGLVVGTTEDGDDADAKTTKKWLEDNTVFVRRYEGGIISVVGPMALAAAIQSMFASE